MKIEAVRKNLYGTDRIYFVDDELQEVWEEVTGKKSITEEDMEYLKSFNIHVEVVEYEPSPSGSGNSNQD